ECALGRVCVNATAVHERGDAQILVLRPENFQLAESGTPAQVLTTSYFGHDGLARLQLGDGTPLLIRLWGSTMPTTGSNVHVRLANARAAADPSRLGSVPALG